MVILKRTYFTILLACSDSPFFSSFQLWPTFLSAYSLSFENQDLNQPQTSDNSCIHELGFRMTDRKRSRKGEDLNLIKGNAGFRF